MVEVKNQREKTGEISVFNMMRTLKNTTLNSDNLTC